MDAYTYIMASRTGTLYVGVTNDIERRVFEHKMEVNKGFTQKYCCKKLVYYCDVGDIGEAIMFEKRIKGWSRYKKEELIRKHNPTWKDLSDGWYDPSWFSVSVSSS